MTAYVHLPDGHMRIVLLDSGKAKDVYTKINDVPKNTVVNVYGTNALIRAGVYTGEAWLTYAHNSGKMSKAKEKYQAYCLDNGLIQFK